MSNQKFDAVVVGAGFAGMYMLWRLRELGLSTHVIERGSGVGGTWYWNRYPGARVDSPSMQYSLSFSPELEQEWQWPENYSDQPALEKYANAVADRFDLRKHIQFNAAVNHASYDEKAKRWTVETDQGDKYTATYFITAAGCLSDTNVPPFKGIESFEGTWYHTSKWPKGGVDLRGKRVGIIGTGSTGIQASPVIAAQAKHLTVFQRTANFSLPSNNAPMDPEFQSNWKTKYREMREAAKHTPGGVVVKEYPNRSALEVSDAEREATFETAWGNYVELLQCFNDIAINPQANEYCAEFVRNKIRKTVKDPVTAEILCPNDHPIGTKRICIDTGYYQTYNRPNVTLVDIKRDPITEITAHGLKTKTRTFDDIDVFVFATGFDAMTGPLFRMDIKGKGGISLKDKWEDGPSTYLGISTVGFPNMFMITGPGSPSVLSNMTTSIEQHVDWVTDAIVYMREHDRTTMEPTQAAETDWVKHVDEVAHMTLYPKAKSWYMGANIEGKKQVFYPYVGGVGAYRAKCDEIAKQDYKGFAFY